jgi:hypothetical protein
MQTVNFVFVRLVDTVRLSVRVEKTVLRGKGLGAQCSRIVTNFYAPFPRGSEAGKSIKNKGKCAIALGEQNAKWEYGIFEAGGDSVPSNIEALNPPFTSKKHGFAV